MIGETDEDLDLKIVDSKIEAVYCADSKGAHHAVTCSDGRGALWFEAVYFGREERIGRQIDFDLGHPELGLENQTGHWLDLENRIEWC